ncbi:hypothetical protein LTR97_004493 [Elasticomyces elasticus]|uniref:AB hydrolase-1 domain-containing protein n=1 Tax=Elasticomyces elasticus TaxID=574655 RepID=A0AAN7W8L9_9PEZI|nr:hypothetical protein LTR97_004493 [Elasticomyces elasticus]
MSENNTKIEYFTVPDFHFDGGRRQDVMVAYRSFNSSSTLGTVLIPTCFGGRINKTLNFTSGALKDHNDCVNSQYALLTQHLGIRSLEAVVGFSMGGQQAYYWAVMHGSGTNPFVKRAIIICGSAKTSGLNYAFLEGPSSALIASCDYDQGRYRLNDIKPINGLRAFGRAYAAWVPSAEWFRQELWRKSGARDLHEWLHPPIGSSSYEKWDPEDLLVKVRMWQAGDVGAVVGNGDYRSALEGITANVLLMPGSTDQYFSVDDSRTEVKFLRDGTIEPIPSIWGHMAGGGANPVDVEWMDAKIAQFMARL